MGKTCSLPLTIRARSAQVSAVLVSVIASTVIHENSKIASSHSPRDRESVHAHEMVHTGAPQAQAPEFFIFKVKESLQSQSQRYLNSYLKTCHFTQTRLNLGEHLACVIHLPCRTHKRPRASLASVFRRTANCISIS